MRKWVAAAVVRGTIVAAVGGAGLACDEASAAESELDWKATKVEGRVVASGTVGRPPPGDYFADPPCAAHQSWYGNLKALDPGQAGATDGSFSVKAIHSPHVVDGFLNPKRARGKLNASFKYAYRQEAGYENACGVTRTCDEVKTKRLYVHSKFVSLSNKSATVEVVAPRFTSFEWRGIPVPGVEPTYCSPPSGDVLGEIWFLRKEPCTSQIPGLKALKSKKRLKITISCDAGQSFNYYTSDEAPHPASTTASAEFTISFKRYEPNS